MAVPPRVGQHHHGPSISRVLRPGVQPGASAFGISRTDPGRDVFRHRGRGASRPGVTRGHRKAGPRGGQPIGRLRDVPLNRRGRLITNSCRLSTTRIRGPSVWERSRRPHVSTSRRPEPVRDHVCCLITAPGHLHDGNSRGRVQNVRADSSELHHGACTRPRSGRDPAKSRAYATGPNAHGRTFPRPDTSICRKGH